MIQYQRKSAEVDNFIAVKAFGLVEYDKDGWYKHSKLGNDFFKWILLTKKNADNK